MSFNRSVPDSTLEPIPEADKPVVALVGEDGNAFAIMGRVQRALRAAGWDAHADEFIERASAGTYTDLIGRTVFDYIQEGAP